MIITMNDTMRNLILPLEFGLEIYSDYEQVYVNKMYGLMSEKTFDNIMREFKEESDK